MDDSIRIIFDRNKSLFLHQLATQFYVSDDDPRANPVIKERCMTSQWRQVGDIARLGSDFEGILS